MSAQLSLLDNARAERDRILDALASSHSAYLDGVRALAVAHAKLRGEVSIDDVRAAMERDGYPMPREVGFDERILGVVFRTSAFEAIRQQPTTRVEWAARVGRARSNVTVYRLRAAS